MSKIQNMGNNVGYIYELPSMYKGYNTPGVIIKNLLNKLEIPPINIYLLL